MSKKFITKKRIVALGLTAMMLLGSSGSFWGLSDSELNQFAFNDLSVTVYAADLSQFKDTIPQWANSDVSYLVDKGIMKGYPDGTFKPSGTMTRLEFLVATVRSLKTDEEINEIVTKWKNNVAEGSNLYDDYCKMINEDFKSAGGKYASLDAKTFWGTPYIMVGSELGLIDNGDLVVNGAVAGIMNYDKPVTRQEAASVMYNACTKVRGESLPESKGIHNIISDFGEIQTQRSLAIERLVSNGLIAGVDDNFTFAPAQKLTRAQACAIIARITDTSRRLAKPTVPEEKQEWINVSAERDITFHNPVTGKDETRDINDWDRLLHAPTNNGKTDGEYSPDGYYQWDADAFAALGGGGAWICLVVH